MSAQPARTPREALAHRLSAERWLLLTGWGSVVLAASALIIMGVIPSPPSWRVAVSIVLMSYVAIALGTAAWLREHLTVVGTVCAAATSLTLILSIYWDRWGRGLLRDFLTSAGLGGVAAAGAAGLALYGLHLQLAAQERKGAQDDVRERRGLRDEHLRWAADHVISATEDAERKVIVILLRDLSLRSEEDAELKLAEDLAEAHRARLTPETTETPALAPSRHREPAPMQETAEVRISVTHPHGVAVTSS